MIAEVLGGRDRDSGALVELVACGIARHLASTLHSQLHAQTIGGNGLQSSCYVAADDDVAEGILLIGGQIVDVNLGIENVVGGRHAAQVELMIRHIGGFLCQLRRNAFAHLCRLAAADDDDVELTTVGAHTAGVERELLRCKGQRFLGFQRKHDSAGVIIGSTGIGRLELQTADTAISAQAGRGQLVAPRELGHGEQTVL